MFPHMGPYHPKHLSSIILGILLLAIAFGTFTWRLALILLGLHLIYQGLTQSSQFDPYQFTERFRRR